MIAWIKSDEGIFVFHGPTGRRLRILTPHRVRYAPTWSPDERYLAVTAEDWGSWDLYLVKSDGSNALLLTRNYRRDAMPAWSPDGQSIVFMSNRTDDGSAGNWHIWVMDADGSNQRPLGIDVSIDYAYGAEQVISWGV